MDPCIHGRLVSAASGDLHPSLYGFRVRTAADLSFLRLGGGEESIEIDVATDTPARPTREPLAEWALRGTSYPARAALYESQHGFEFWTTDTGRFLIEPDRGRIELPIMEDTLLREQRLCGIPMILSYAHRGDFSLHAAAVEVNGGAVLLAAGSKSGKTTLAFAFHRAGFRVLSEDLVCCRPTSLEVLPGPAVIRLRPDVFDGSVPTGTSVARTSPDRLVLSIDQNRRGTSAPVPLKGVVFLNEADAISVTPVAASAVIPSLWNLNFHLPTAADRGKAFRQLANMAGEVPAWDLYRPLRLDRLEETVGIIAALVS